jgi:hypothetical protein
MKLFVLVLTMVAFFAPAAPAALAKGPDQARACGAVRCVSIHGTAAAALLDWGGQSEFDLLAAPRRVPYYRITLYERGTHTWEFLYAPSVSRVRITELDVYPFGSIGPYWRAVTSEGRAAFARVIRGLTPFAASRTWRR